MSKENEFILELRHIHKCYPGVVALKDVSISIRRGEVHAILGENGAGKSTLIKICSGAIIPNDGQIIFDHQTYSHMTPEKAIQLGIAVIYQELNLIHALSVAENIFLGRAIKRGCFLDKKTMVQKAKEIFNFLEIDIDPNTPIHKLTVGYQQMVEIAKALSKEAKLIIMDEPTAPLTKAETETLYKVVDRLKEKGISIIYISHRLEDIFRLADRLTFLRDGEYITTLNKDVCTEDHMISLMVGRTLEEKFPKAPKRSIGKPILKLNHIFGHGVKDITLEINKGEILGIGGLIGSGRSELTELIFGVYPIEKGHMIFKDKSYHPTSPAEAIKAGLGLVPEDRKQHGLILLETINDNINLPILKRDANTIFVNKKKSISISKKYQVELQIKTPTIEQLVQNLSGGNQQKVVISKWLAADTDLIILDEPTRGIDVGAKYEIYKLMYQLIEEGKTILMVSSEMEELLGMCDRIAVLSEGRLTGILNKEEFSQEAVMTLASKKGELYES